MAHSPQKITAKLERIPPSLVCPFPDISSQAMWIFDPAAKNAVSVRLHHKRASTIGNPHFVIAGNPYGNSVMQAAQWHGEEQGQAFGLLI
jgi:hypothetical protein